MGAFGHKTCAQLGLSRKALLASTLALMIVGTAAKANAGSTASTDPGNQPPLALRPNNTAPPADSETESPVSTSPGASARPAATPRDPLAGEDPEDLPLTRAATRRRIEAMSPVTWLSSFGSVTVGRPE